MSSSNGHSSAKRQRNIIHHSKADEFFFLVSEEIQGASSTADESSGKSDTKTVDKPSAPKTFDSVSDDGPDSTPAKKGKSLHRYQIIYQWKFDL